MKTHFSILSTKKCKTKTCNKRIKARLAEKHPYCYECWKKREAKRGHFINTQPKRKRRKRFAS